MSTTKYQNNYYFFTIFIEKVRNKLLRTLPLYIVSIKTLFHICKNKIHTQIADNPCSK